METGAVQPSHSLYMRYHIHAVPNWGGWMWLIPNLIILTSDRTSDLMLSQIFYNAVITYMKYINMLPLFKDHVLVSLTTFVKIEIK